MNIDDLQIQDIAPCGVNCMACSARFNTHTPCPGCRAPEDTIPRKSCRSCTMKNCAQSHGVTWCFECREFPCVHIKQLSKRYQNNYNINLIENGEHARTNIDAFLEEQRKRFTCQYCGGIIDQHNRRCSLCASEGR